MLYNHIDSCRICKYGSSACIQPKLVWCTLLHPPSCLVSNTLRTSNRITRGTTPRELRVSTVSVLFSFASTCPPLTSQSELSSNNGQATKTSKEPVYWSPYPGWEVPQSWGPGFRGEALLPLRALREAAQRVTRKENDRHGIPRCGARRRSFDHPAPMAQASSCSSTPAFKSLPRSRARISVPRSELA